MTRLLLTVILAFVIAYSEAAVSSDDEHPAKRTRKADFASDREKQDWITFFKRGHLMNESQVKEQIQTPEVLQAFERAKLSSMPVEVKEAYDDEDRQYDRYSQHTAEVASKGKAEGIAEGKKEGLLKAALGMKRLNIPTAQIVEATGLSASEVDDLKVDDQEL